MTKSRRINRPQVPIQALVERLRFTHGWEIDVERGGGVWEVYVPATKSSFVGPRKMAFSYLLGYEDGFAAGRKYTEEEKEALARTIAEVSHAASP